MIPWQQLGTAVVPGGKELRLKRRGAEFSITVGVSELMNSRLSGSEEALATLAADRLGQRPAARVLIGGLGMGFTLRAAMTCFSPDARFIVSELATDIVDWARGPMAELFGGCLDDPRVEVRIEDVADNLRQSRGAYDAILLDVDNGPEGMTAAANDSLYDSRGIGIATAALRPGGVLSIWSAHRDGAFAARLRRSGLAVEEVMVRAHRGKKGAKHTIWLVTKNR
jgi:spermidine synthase